MLLEEGPYLQRHFTCSVRECKIGPFTDGNCVVEVREV